MHIFTTIFFSVFILSIATATVSVYTMELSQPNKNRHFKMFALSVATATVSVDTLYFVYIFTTIIVSVFTLSVATATVSVDTMELGQPNKNIILTCLH